MSEDQITYWCLAAITVCSFGLGTWIFFRGESLIRKGTKEWLGETPVRVLAVIMRVLGFLLVLVTSYLFVALWRVLPCALK